MTLKISVAVAQLTPREVVNELAALRQDMLRLEPTNARALDTIRQAARIIMELCDAADTARDTLVDLNAFYHEKLNARDDRIKALENKVEALEADSKELDKHL